MKKIKKNLIIFVLLIILPQCGFKVLDKSKINNFSIKEIQSEGDDRINFKIKNNLRINEKENSKNILNLTLSTQKNKSIKEKNIKNEITKYEIVINTTIKFSLSMSNGKIYSSSLSSQGDFLVANNYATTLDNEKKLIDNLTDDLSEKIIDKILSEINDI